MPARFELLLTRKMPVPIPDGKVPLYSSDGRLVGSVDEDFIRIAGGRVNVVRNRRQHIQRVIWKASLTAHAVPLLPGGRGQAFEEELSCGHVWSLRRHGDQFRKESPNAPGDAYLTQVRRGAA